MIQRPLISSGSIALHRLEMLTSQRAGSYITAVHRHIAHTLITVLIFATAFMPALRAGLVLCVAPDGHVAIETTHTDKLARHCHNSADLVDHATVAHASLLDHSDIRVATLPPDCVDTVPAYAMLPASKHLVSPISLPLNLLPISSFSMTATPTIDAARAFSQASVPPIWLGRQCVILNV